MHSSRGSCIGLGELACVQGEPFVLFELCFDGSFALCLSLVFFSVVLSRCSCLRGQRLVFFM
jgi:hypothetical protein